MTALGEAERLRLLEERRKAMETVLWQLPSVSIAAQAFLLNAGLDANAPRGTQILVGILGIMAVIATAFVVAFMGAQATVLGRWLDNRLQPLDKKAMVDLLESDHQRKLNPVQKALLKLPTPFWFWGLTLAGFVVADVLVLFGRF